MNNKSQKKIMFVLGILCLVVGIIMTVTSASSMMDIYNSSMFIDSIDDMASAMRSCMVGVIMAIVGVVVIIAAALKKNDTQAQQPNDQDNTGIPAGMNHYHFEPTQKVLVNRFSDNLEYAVRQIWVEAHGDVQRAFNILQQEAQAGDADAYYFLGRCYLGKGFVPLEFGFEENEELGKEYFNKSIEMGSAVGMFAAQRLAGFTPRNGSGICAPYHTKREVWDAVYTLALDGEVFCQYLIGNAFYFGDVVDMLDVKPLNNAVVMVFMYKAMELYDMCIEQGMYLCIPNYLDIITTGDYGMPIMEEKARELRRIRESRIA